MATKRTDVEVDEFEIADRTGEPQFITRGKDPELPMRHWLVKAARVGERRINATTIEDAIRAFNAAGFDGKPISYARPLLRIDEIDRAGNVIKSDEQMRKEADDAKERYRKTIYGRWDPQPTAPAAAPVKQAESR